MKVGLIRHFQVERGYPKRIVTPVELIRWVDEYDASNVIENDVDLGDIQWEHCYSSDLFRAKKTAESIFTKEIVFLKELREVRLAPLFHWNIKLPLMVHVIMIRLAWLLNHRTQPETKLEVKKRIQEALNKILDTEKDVLIVGHGGIMLIMRKELSKRGFVGPSFKKPKNGKLYIFEKV